MNRMPQSAIWLGRAGLVPFLWGVALIFGFPAADLGDTADSSYPVFLTPDGKRLLLSYGTLILSFMSGVLWGFATRARDRDRFWAYGLSVLPVIWAFINAGSVEIQLLRLALGFAGLLGLDWFYRSRDLAPDWWLYLRVPLTLIVVVCLLIGAFA